MTGLEVLTADGVVGALFSIPDVAADGRGLFLRGRLGTGLSIPALPQNEPLVVAGSDVGVLLLALLAFVGKAYLGIEGDTTVGEVTTGSAPSVLLRGIGGGSRGAISLC